MSHVFRLAYCMHVFVLYQCKLFDRKKNFCFWKRPSRHLDISQCLFYYIYLELRKKKTAPTSSHTSAPSYAPIITSNNPFCFFIHACWLLRTKDFLEWLIIIRTYLYMIPQILALLLTIFPLMMGRSFWCQKLQNYVGVYPG